MTKAWWRTFYCTTLCIYSIVMAVKTTVIVYDQRIALQDKVDRTYRRTVASKLNY